MRPLFLRLISFLNGMDCGLTLLLVRLGLAQEVNPLMAPLLKHQPLLFIAGKLLLMEVGLSSLWKNRDNKSSRYILWGTLSIYTAVVAWSLWQMRHIL